LKDQWYGDNRDLIKWGGIVRLCQTTGIKNVLQVAYWRPSQLFRLRFDGNNEDIPKEVIQHFRDIRDIKRLADKTNITIDIVDPEFTDRNLYTKDVCQRIQQKSENQIVFLDPDTGLAKQNGKAAHVILVEVQSMWQALKQGDILVLYQHSFREKNWRNIRLNEFAEACGVQIAEIKTWEASEKVRDVIFFYCKKGTT